MKDLFIRKNELSKKSQNLQTAKFEGSLTRDKVTKLIEEQDKIYKQFYFYKKFLEAQNKERRIKRWKFIFYKMEIISYQIII